MALQLRPLALQMPGGRTRTRRKKGPLAGWQQEVQTEDEADIFEEWAYDLVRRKNYRVGRWRQTIEARGDVKNLKDFKLEEKTPGTLLRTHPEDVNNPDHHPGGQWCLFFHQDSFI